MTCDLCYKPKPCGCCTCWFAWSARGGRLPSSTTPCPVVAHQGDGLSPAGLGAAIGKEMADIIASHDRRRTGVY